eukprot:scaffold82096_cov30-Cyclotella_meneghiniana.AAC.1
MLEKTAFLPPDPSPIRLNNVTPTTTKLANLTHHHHPTNTIRIIRTAIPSQSNTTQPIPITIPPPRRSSRYAPTTPSVEHAPTTPTTSPCRVITSHPAYRPVNSFPLYDETTFRH